MGKKVEAERQRLIDEKKKKAEDAKKEEPEEPPVELTDEEKKLWYRKLEHPDLAEKTLATAFADFSLPEAAEGFDSITFDWQPESASASFLKDWVLQKKITSRVDNLVPGASFKEAWSKWTQTYNAWRKRQTEWKDPAKRKALVAKKKEEAK